MDFNANSDYFSLAEEKFDFDVSLSPASLKGNEDEDDEVFVGPVCHKERCISVGLDTHVKDSVSSGGLSMGEEPSWSPLTGEKFDEICKEAQQLACELEGIQQHPDNGETNGTLKDSKEEPKEDFVQDSGAKLGMLSQPACVVLSPIKRETFCVQDSPMKELPPAIQKRLLRANGAPNCGGVPSTAKAGVGSVNTSSPVRGAKSRMQTRMVLRGRASLACVNGVLPSKPAAPVGNTAPTMLNTTRTRPAPEKTTRLPPPNKGNSGLRRSLASRESSKVSSSEDLLSDTTTVASDISDSSLNSSLQGRRGLVPPKKTGPQVVRATKAPPPQTKSVADRNRNTSSSSSSVSSLNSSLSVSPTGKAKLNSSLNSSIGGPSGRVPASTTRLANPTAGASAKTRRSLLVGRAPEPPPPTRASTSIVGGRRSISACRRPSEVVRSTPIKRPHGGVSTGMPMPLHHTPAKRAMERTSSVPNIPSFSATLESVGRANPKLKPFFAPTPSCQLNRLRRSEAISSPEAPNNIKPKRLISACSVDSHPQTPTAPAHKLLQTPSAGGNKSLQPKMIRPSVLPTPVNRRVSGIPMLTPKSVSRPARPTLSVANQPASTTCRASQLSPVQMENQHQEKVVETADPEEEPVCLAEEAQLPVFSLEEEQEAQTSATAPQAEVKEILSSVSKVNRDLTKPSKEEQQEDTHPNMENQEPSLNREPVKTIGLSQTNGIKTELSEVLLVDAPPPVLRPQEKLLIDLSNTPEQIKTTSSKPSGGQLIDLSSPLIKWSPENQKENIMNDAPLINLSF